MRLALLLFVVACDSVAVPADSGSHDASHDASDSTQHDAASRDASGVGDGAVGESLGRFFVTYYYVALESDYSGDEISLRSADCSELATVPRTFYNDLCIEGSGRLSDGRGLGYAGDCECAIPCDWDGARKCWSVLGAATPWGIGATENALEPFRSWAVDPAAIPLGTVVYVPQWDGVEIPAIDNIGGFTHDGCFRADDTGGAVLGRHYDFFAGTTSMWQALEAIFPTESEMEVFRAGSKCDGLR